MLANSATAPPATTSVPTSECRLWVSRSTGTTMPTEVEQSATATSSGRERDAGGVQRERAAGGQGEGDDEARDAEPERLAAERAEVELGAGEEQQERDPEQGEEARDVVDAQQAQHLRPDEDAGDDLQHDRRHPQPREEAEHERHAEGEHRDAEQVEEVLLHRPAPPFRRRLQRAGSRPGFVAHRLLRSIRA